MIVVVIGPKHAVGIGDGRRSLGFGSERSGADAAARLIIEAGQTCLIDLISIEAVRFVEAQCPAAPDRLLTCSRKMKDIDRARSARRRRAEERRLRDGCELCGCETDRRDASERTNLTLEAPADARAAPAD